MFATENMRCCAGPPLPETLKLLAPLANLEELSLGGNELGGAITADVAVLTKLKKLDCASWASTVSRSAPGLSGLSRCD